MCSNQINEKMENKYSELEKLLCRNDNDPFNKFIEEVDINKIDFFFLCSLLGGGSYNVSSRARKLLLLIDPVFYDYDTLIYFRKEKDHRAYEVIDELIAKIPVEKRILTGLEAFKKNN